MKKKLYIFSILVLLFGCIFKYQRKSILISGQPDLIDCITVSTFKTLIGSKGQYMSDATFGGYIYKN